MSTPITKAGLYPDLPFTDYLAHDSLSSTFARLLTNHVPAKARERARNNRPTKAMNLGTAAHLEALGAGPQLIVWQHDGRTKDGKAERAEWASQIADQSAVAVTEAERAQVLGMAEALRAHDEVRAILEAAQSEVSAFWQDETTGIWMRARYDLLGARADDYKTTQDVSRRGFGKTMGTFGYHLQSDFYQRGLAALGHPAAEFPLRFICQETEPPYLVQIHTPDDMALEVGRVLNDRAIRIYAECMKSGLWPGYESIDAEPASLPGWYLYDFEDVLPDEWRPLEESIVI